MTKSQLKSGWTGKHHWPVSDIIRICPHLKAKDIKQLAVAQNWRSLPYGGTPEYFFDDLPDEVQTTIIDHAIRMWKLSNSESPQELLATLCPECQRPHLGKTTWLNAKLRCFRCTENNTV